MCVPPDDDVCVCERLPPEYLLYIYVYVSIYPVKIVRPRASVYRDLCAPA